MTATRWTWLVCAGLWLVFFSWYTSFGGPLTDEEVEAYLAHFAAGDRAPQDLANLRRFLEEDTGDDFVMLNNLDLYADPPPVEGAPPDASSEELLGLYMAYMYPALFARASHPVLFGTTAADALDEVNAPTMRSWTTGAAMRYRSRRDMMEITVNPAFAGRHEFKIAALRKTIAYPLDPWFHPGDPRLLLGLLLALVASLLSWRFAAAAAPGGGR